jgi:acyl transferase domain-containing protein
MSKQRVVVICPGRGSYTKDNLGSLKNRTSIQLDVQWMDEERQRRGYPTISELDGADQFKVSLHTKGEHASPLIYACAKADFLEINPDKYEIVAIAGNSMGWYLTLAFAGALNPQDSYHLIQTMGSMMEGGLVGGQVIYPIIDEAWQISPQRVQELESIVTAINSEPEAQVYTSIHLGGYRVLAGNKAGVSQLLARLPKQDPYPFQLVNHGAFHTPLLKEISQTAEHSLYRIQFQKPRWPMIDGRGHVWPTYATHWQDLYNYTLGHQVTETYDFTRSVEVALKEFAPDRLVLLGPGNSLGGAIGQILIKNQWLGLKNKEDFQRRQEQDPFLLSMGVEEQATRVR